MNFTTFRLSINSKSQIAYGISRTDFIKKTDYLIKKCVQLHKFIVV